MWSHCWTTSGRRWRGQRRLAIPALPFSHSWQWSCPTGGYLDPLVRDFFLFCSSRRRFSWRIARTGCIILRTHWSLQFSILFRHGGRGDGELHLDLLPFLLGNGSCRQIPRHSLHSDQQLFVRSLVRKQAPYRATAENSCRTGDEVLVAFFCSSEPNSPFHHRIHLLMSVTSPFPSAW